MRLSKNFTRTIKQAPADEVARNAQLLIRAGYVRLFILATGAKGG